jgi:hypothetical protein
MDQQSPDTPSQPTDEEAFWGIAPSAPAVTAPAPPPPAAKDDEFWGISPAPASAPGAPAHRPVRQWLAVGIGTVVVAAAAWGGVNLSRHESTTLAGAANAGPGGFGRGGFAGFGDRGTNGTVASIDGTRFTVTTRGGETVTVATSPSTTFTAASTGSPADVKAGDNVTVLGTTSGTTVEAERITDTGSVAPPDGAGAPNGGPPPVVNGPAGDGRGGPPAAGVVKAVNGSSFTVATTAGTTLTVNTSSSTAVTVVRPSSFAALKVGDEVQVNGTTSGTTVTATNVRVGEAGFGPFDGRGFAGPTGGQPPRR